MATVSTNQKTVTDASVHAFRSQRYDLAVDTISHDEIEALIEWLRAYPRLTMADETKRFEKAWAEWLGVRYCVMCNSGSSANLLMYAALESSGRAPRKKVIVPSTGWATTIAPALQLGWAAAMTDSSETTFGMDIHDLTRLVEKERPEAVILVHVLGVPNDMEPILALKKKYNFALMEDCCASHGSLHRGKKVGTFGDLSSFSFYYGHHMSTIEGGVVCTNDEELYHHVLMLRSHGWLKDLPDDGADALRKKHDLDGYHNSFNFVIAGYNVRPTDLNAHLGLLQLRRLDDVVARRVENHQVYQQRLRGIVDFAPGLAGDQISSISFCAVAKDSRQRRRIVEALDDHAIDTRIFTAGNLGRHPFWSQKYGRFQGRVADRLHDGGFFLPNNQTIGRAEVNFACDVVASAVKVKGGRT